MPGSLITGNKLNDLAVSANKEVGRNMKSLQIFKFLSGTVQAVREECFDIFPSEGSGRKANPVNNYQRDLFSFRSFIEMRGWHSTNIRRPALLIKFVAQSVILSQMLRTTVILVIFEIGFGFWNVNTATGTGNHHLRRYLFLIGLRLPLHVTLPISLPF